ncbi:YjcZ family sporulation protein [Alkalihalobacillus clausii]|nr:YjcZ family sporulation protein [Shouchella clausii]
MTGGVIRLGFKYDGGFAFIVVLFILLVIVGSAYVY